MKSADAISNLERDHEDLAANLARLGDFVRASEAAPAREEWDALQAHLLAHLDAEEMFLLPAFERDHRVECAAIREEHARLRKTLGEMGIAIDLHVLPVEKVEELQVLLAAHAKVEQRLLYQWARDRLNDDVWRAVGRQLAPSTPEDRTAIALGEVIRACQDGEKGYRVASSLVTDSGYRETFSLHADERARFASSLTESARALGLAVPQHGSALGRLHRGWLRALSSVSKGDTAAVLRECQRGEEAALTTYRAALLANLPAHLREPVQMQEEAIAKAHEEISSSLVAKQS